MATNQQRREAAKRKLERQLARRAEKAKRRRIIGVGVTVGAVVVIAGLVVILTTQGDAEDADAAGQDGSSSAEPSSKVDIPTQRVATPKRPKALPNPTSCDYKKSGQAAKKAEPPPSDGVPSEGTVDVDLKSSAGDIPITLDRSLAPCTVNSFASLAQQGYFTDTSCHRLSTTGLQMLQCGDPSGSGSGGPGYAFNDELFDGLKYGRGVLAMANAGPNTNGSQFFMVYGKAELPPNYTVFGSISDSGLKVLDKIARAGDDGRFDSSAGGGKPNMDVKFTDVTVKA